MNKPEKEMLLAVLDEKTLNNGNVIYTGFLGFNSIHASVYNGKLYIRLQKWPKKENLGNVEINSLSNETDVPF